jgi:ABC-type bacteriocin/lantibiotic exporter with double-glycine peptidase domain
LIYKSAYLTQKPFIFSGTIRDNIAMKKTEVNDKLIINILNEITAENFSKDLDKYLENNGENISSGQRQKIVLARALYNRADLIFIDEATNAIDSKSEEIIYKYLLGMDGVTIVSVSHRENINNLFQKKILLD